MASILTRLRRRLRLRARFRCVLSPLVGQAGAAALDEGLARTVLSPWRVGTYICLKTSQWVVSLWHMGKATYGKMLLQVPRLVRKLHRAYWLSLYRLCFVCVLLRGRSTTRLKSVWRKANFKT